MSEGMPKSRFQIETEKNWADKEDEARRDNAAFELEAMSNDEILQLSKNELMMRAGFLPNEGFNEEDLKLRSVTTATDTRILRYDIYRSSSGKLYKISVDLGGFPTRTSG